MDLHLYRKENYLKWFSTKFLGKFREVVNAHEFHYSKMDNESNDCFMQKPSSTKNWVGAKLEDNLYAGYPHLYYLGNLNIAKRFIEKALNYKTDNI